MMGLLNGGSNVERARRIGMINYQTGAVTGVICALELRRYPATMTWTTPTSVSPVKHDTTNSALSSVTTGHAGTPGGSTPDVLRRFIWSSDEASASTATSDEWECLVPLNILWDAGYGDAAVQSLAIRQNEGVVLYNNSGAAGIVDVWMEFTDEAS
jgi:hypothetical protein